MPKKPVIVEVVEEGDDRFLRKTYTDGSVVRVPIVEGTPRKERLSKKIAWYLDLKTGRRKFY